MDNTHKPTTFQAPELEELAPLLPAYELETFIAKGGMGAVYQARQKSLDRPVAIKILPREFGDDESFRESFTAEARAMARLNHPNLISVFDFGDIDGMLYLVMEIVHGKSLFHSCYGKKIDPAQASEIIIAICRGIDHAHDAGILHRDIKPPNILLDQDTTPKVGDFGLAAPMNQSANPGEVIYGTPGYTAPEVLQRQPVDRRADVFSIGVMLHELLTGKIPDENTSIQSQMSGCPIGYDTIITCSTHPNPKLRYSTAGELADALENLPSQAATPILKTTVAPTSLKSKPATGYKPTIPSTTTKSPALAVTLTIVAIIAAITGIAMTSTSKPDDTPESQNEPVVVTKKPVTPSKKTAKNNNKKPTNPKPKERRSIANKVSPIKQLTKLRDKLSNGDRNNFPNGTVKRNGSHYLVLDHPLTRHEAIAFAEAHGAHLAVLPDPDNRAWVLSRFDSHSHLWIGAGLSANNTWQWHDYSAWDNSDNPSKPTQLSATGYLTTSSSGKLVPQSANATHPIILQWRNDGSNPCTMDSQLKRTLQSIQEKGLTGAQYPVGTRTHNNSHFLLLEKSLSWDAARKFAEDYKAHLAVPTTPDENTWLATTYSNKKYEINFWLGGYQENSDAPWQWTTQEAWYSPTWKKGEPKTNDSQNRMLMSLDASLTDNTNYWVSATGQKEEINAILLEWSKPKKAPPRKAYDIDQWLVTVNRKIMSLVKSDIDAYQKDRSQLITNYMRDMKRASRKVDIPNDRRGRAEERLQMKVEELIEEIKESGELPNRIPAKTPTPLQKIHNQSVEQLRELTDAYEVKLKAHAEFYQKGLASKAELLKEDGFTQQASSLQKSTSNIGTDTSEFLKAIGL